MFEIRAKDKDGKLVYGWYVHACKTNLCNKVYWEHQIHIPDKAGFTPIFEIPDISTVAVKTGRKDKNGKDIYGSMGEMKGGDRVRSLSSGQSYLIGWGKCGGCWVGVSEDGNRCYLHYENFGNTEIIPQEEG